MGICSILEQQTFEEEIMEKLGNKKNRKIN